MLPEDEPDELAPPVCELLDGLVLAPLELELDGLGVLLLGVGLELMPLEELVPPVALLFWPASYSARESCPSWFLSSLSNSEELEDDDVPPAAELGLDDDELDVPPADDEVDGEEDDLLLCDMDGEELGLEELFEASSAA